MMALSDSGEFDSIEIGIDLSDFYRSVEWDVMAVPARKSIRSYAGSVDPFPQWTFNVTLKRKFLFYTVNLIIPLMSHAFITVLVFYIPAASTEKMSLSINVLLSLTVFFLMLAEIIPPTSLVVPLLGKYLVFTLILVASSVIITVITYNVHFRSAATHVMPDWTRKVFLYWLPRLLCMRRPKVENSQDVHLKHIRLKLCLCLDRKSSSPSTATSNAASARLAAASADNHQPAGQRGVGRRGSAAAAVAGVDAETGRATSGFHSAAGSSTATGYCDEQEMQTMPMDDLSPAVRRAVHGALYIANHLKKEDEFRRVR